MKDFFAKIKGNKGVSTAAVAAILIALVAFLNDATQQKIRDTLGIGAVATSVAPVATGTGTATVESASTSADSSN